MQDIIVYIIVGATIAYAVWRAVRRKDKGCHCAGCQCSTCQK